MTFGFAVNAGVIYLRWEKEADGSPWSVGVVTPMHPDLKPDYSGITDRAVCTSEYRQAQLAA